jgi:hypothetical protein
LIGSVAPADSCENLLVGWPTKLTLAPNLANQALELLHKACVHPTPSNAANLQGQLPKPSVAPTPWEIAFPPALSKEESLMLKLQEELVEAYDEEQDEPYGVENFMDSHPKDQH